MTDDKPAGLSLEEFARKFTIQGHAQEFPDKTALIFQDRRFTYREFNDRINRFANGVKGLGLDLAEGDKACILLHNCNEFYEATNGLGRINLIGIPISYQFKGGEIEYIATNSESKLFILGEEFVDTIQSIRPALGNIERYIVVGENCPGDMIRYDELLESASAEALPASTRTVLRSMRYTSGTTGRPKGVVREAIREKAIMHAMEIARDFNLRPDDISLVACPLYHAAPPFYSGMTLTLGGTVYIMPKFDPVQFLEIIEKERVTTTTIVPTIFQLLLNVPEDVRNRYDTSSLRVIIFGAAPCPTEVKRRFIEFVGDGKLYEYYGSTDGSHNAILRPEEQLRKLGSIGRPHVGNVMKVFDENGNEVPPGVVGELHVKNDFLLKEYYKAPEATKESFTGEFYNTGDMAKMDEDGYFYLVDRKKDMVISGGVNIYPAEVEEVLFSHLSVLDAAVIGVPDDLWGESLKALIVLKDGQDATSEEMIEHCGNHLADYKKPRSVEFVSELPRTPEGKLLKRELRTKYWTGRERKI